MSAFYQSEQCFRRYEPAIASALGNYPNPIRFSSTKRSPATDAARCTNALRSYQKNKWESTYPIFAQFEDRPLRVWFDKTHTIVGPALKDELAAIAVENEQRQQALFVRDPSNDDVRYLVDLLDRGVLGMPLEFPNRYKDVIEEEVMGRMNVVTRQEVTTVIVF